MGSYKNGEYIYLWFKEFTTWQVKADNIHLIATFINDLNGNLEGIAPFSVSVTHNGKILSISKVICHNRFY